MTNLKSLNYRAIKTPRQLFQFTQKIVVTKHGYKESLYDVLSNNFNYTFETGVNTFYGKRDFWIDCGDGQWMNLNTVKPCSVEAVKIVIKKALVTLK